MALVFVTFAAHRAALERGIETSVSRKSAFDLGVWNSRCLDDVRRSVRAHPAHYLFADWSIGRALALELRYRPQSGTTAMLADGIPDAALKAINPGHVVLRAVGPP